MLTRHALGFRGVGHDTVPDVVFMCTAVQLRTWQVLREGGMACEAARLLSKLCPRCWPFGGAQC